MTRRLRALALLLALLGCAGQLPAPAIAQHPLAAYVEVPYPPPAALAETIPERPASPGVVWIDGEWRYHGGGYVWRRGGWVAPPPGSRFGAWRSWYRRDGRLMLAPGTWYVAHYERLRTPAAIVPAFTPPNEITSESQTGR